MKKYLATLSSESSPEPDQTQKRKKRYELTSDEEALDDFLELDPAPKSYPHTRKRQRPHHSLDNDDDDDHVSVVDDSHKQLVLFQPPKSVHPTNHYRSQNSPDRSKDDTRLIFESQDEELLVDEKQVREDESDQLDEGSVHIESESLAQLQPVQLQIADESVDGPKVSWLCIWFMTVSNQLLDLIN
jgi:hypothetical protein